MMKTGLPPIAGEDAAVLVLGTFPGEQSLADRQYYAYPRNLFWDMMDEICGAGRQQPYEKRCQILISHKIAVWDVLQACDREGSADGRIRQPVVNDFTTFFGNHQCRTVFFNGNLAFKLFTKHVKPDRLSITKLVVLPSTSPANAGMSIQEKRLRWGEIGGCILSINGI